MSDTASTNLAGSFERARTLHQRGELPLARQIYQDILSRDPGHYDTLNLMGVLSAQSQDYEQAVGYFNRAVEAQPSNPSAYCNRGLALKEAGQMEAALVSFDRAIGLSDEDVVAHYSRAKICHALGRFAEALTGFTKAIEVSPQFAPAYYQRAALLAEEDRVEEALTDYETAIRLKPDYVEAFAGRAFLLHRLKRFEAALASYDQVIAIDPAHAPSYVNRGNALKEMSRLDAALASYDAAIRINSGYAEAYSNRGLVLYRLDRIEAALSSFDRAVELKPDYPDAYFNRASILRAVKAFEAAAADFERAASLGSDIKFLPGASLEVKMQICDWTNFDADLAAIIERVAADQPAAHPFTFLTFSDSPELQRKAAEIWVRETCPPDASLGPFAKRHGGAKKIRIGYFSADFREHPVARLIARLIETHDRSRFEVVALSFGADTQDELRKRLERSFDQFYDVRDKSSQEIASLARHQSIDIAIDLGGYTHGSRPNIFAMRAAPVQISYLGYAGTMGASYIDYVVADPTLVPPGADIHFTEKVIFLPNSYIVNDDEQSAPDMLCSREELGLPARGFVFCCFNNDHKIVPATFACWMRILDQVPASVLWLLKDNPTAASNLRARAAAAGIKTERLVFCERATLTEHLARHRAADLFLDTLPYNAHTTASDALCQGLPILTCMGRSFAGRVAASLLGTLDLSELVTHTLQAYERKAVDLGNDPARMTVIKSKLAENRLTRPLFDIELFTNQLESALEEAHVRHLTELPADHIHVCP